MDEVEKLKNVSIDDFNFSFEELSKIYANSNILLNPTRQDSMPMVILEAMKAGSNNIIYRFICYPGDGKDGYTGFLTQPKYRFFDLNNMPYEPVWNYREETIYSDYIDEDIIQFLYEKIRYLAINQDKLEEMSINSYNFSNSGKYNIDFIKQKWSSLLTEIYRDY